MRHARALIDPAALRHNLGVARRFAPDSRVIAVVKADAYGHGLATALEALDGADAFAVASSGEGALLRRMGVTARVMVLQGFLDRRELRLLARHRLEPVIHQDWQVELLAAHRPGLPLRVWLKVDSGMHRMGVPVGQAGALHARLAAIPHVQGTPGVMTHMACADEDDPRPTRGQLEAFRVAVDGLGAERSAANSASLIAFPESRMEWTRPGIMLYGCSPFANPGPEAEALRPAMTLKTRLIAVQHYREGDRVGYGATYACPEDMPVGIAAIGYGDGYPRHARNGTPVLVGGRRVPLAGRVSMDSLTLDLRTAPDARPGDEVVLWGEGLPVHEIADWSDTIGYELLCAVGNRVERIVRERS